MKRLLLMTICAVWPLAVQAGEPLPGVKGGHSIVQPEPMEDPPLPANEDGSFQVGNTRVKISGSVTVDIGVGNAPTPRK